MGTCSETICKHRIHFPSIQQLAWLPQGRPQGKQKCGKIAIFGLTHWLKHRITRKLLNIDRYMLQVFWRALNCLSIHATYCVIIAWASPGETKMWAAVRKNSDFYRAMLCITAVYAVMRCLSVCASVCLSRSWIMSKRNFDQYLALSSKCCNREP